MTRLEFDFNDMIYQHTGINLNSSAMLENELVKNSGETFFVQIWKRNVDMKETLSIALRDAEGCSVEDLCLSVNNRTLRLDADSTREGISVELESGVKHFEMTLESESHGLKVELAISLEQNYDTPSPEGLEKEKSAEEEHSRRLAR